MRYARALQGHLSSGDGYNQRFDTVLIDFVDKERCVDDTVYWDEDLESHWWRTIHFLEICGNNGIVLNPKQDFNKIRAVTWERIEAEMSRDTEMKELLLMVMEELPTVKHQMPSHLRKYWKYRESIHAVDNILLCEDRVLIPPSLRDEVLEGLHAAYQGVVAMTNRTSREVTWPGITADIQNSHNKCRTCNRNAPTQPRHLPEGPVIPTMPFESVCIDFFQIEGWHYLVIVDRFSGWSEIKRAKAGTATAGSQGLLSRHEASICRLWSLQERALRSRAAKAVETLSKHAKDLPHLRIRLVTTLANGPHWSDCRMPTTQLIYREIQCNRTTYIA